MLYGRPGRGCENAARLLSRGVLLRGLTAAGPAVLAAKFPSDTSITGQAYGTNSIAGIISPPGKDKYGHYTNDGPMESSTTWKEEAEFHKGSWWPRWGAWLAERSGKRVAARQPGAGGRTILAPAPGTYVTEVPNG